MSAKPFNGRWDYNLYTVIHEEGNERLFNVWLKEKSQMEIGDKGI